MTRIQFGWSLPSGPPEGMSRHAYLEGVQKGFELIKGHFDSLWFVDHLQSDNDPLLEGWTALTYFAALHPEFTFGHVVLCQSFRNPALLAKMATTAQFLSGGRFLHSGHRRWLEGGRVQSLRLRLPTSWHTGRGTRGGVTNHQGHVAR